MPRVVIFGHDKALLDILATGLEASGSVESCRKVCGLEEDSLEEDSLDGVDVCVVTVPEVRGFPDVEGTARLCARLRHAGRMILISSAAVHEPSHHHPGLVSEEPLRALRHRKSRGGGGGNALTARWRDLEDRVREAAPENLIILRPTALLVPGGRGYWSRLFAGRVAFTLSGFDPTLQVLDARHLAAVVSGAIEDRGRCAGGVFHVVAKGIPLSKALRATRTLRVPVPRTLQRLTRWLLAPLGAAPLAQLDYLRYSWTASGEKLRRDLGVGPASCPWPDGGLEDREHDEFGFDQDHVARLGKTVFRFLHDFWWRVEWKGLENVPREGRAVLTGVHRGHQPWDGMMTLHLLQRELGRFPRFLIHPALIKFPFLAPYLIKCGGVGACRENAAWLLERDDILGIFPEGIQGAFSMYRDAYKLGRFGRDEFVKMALRHQAPIIPYVILGSAEAFPIFGRINWRWWKRYAEWPFIPITPTMSTIPLPSKWHMWFLDPIHVEQHPPEAANDPAIVRAISQQVREQMERALDELLRRRKSIFWGSIFKTGVSKETL